MSVDESEVQVDTECSICGKPGLPLPECEICHGNQAFVAKRAYTLTEERRGEGKNDPSRYSRTGNVSPQIVSRPGSFTPNPNQ